MTHGEGGRDEEGTRARGMAASMRRGVTWTGASMVATTGGQALQALAATWFMPPAEYGLFVIALLLVGVLRQIAEAGFNEAVIVLRTASGRQLSALFTVGLVFGLLAATAITVAAPPLAGAVGDPLLARVLWIMALLCPVLALGQVHLAVMERDLRFRDIGRAEVAGAVAGLALMLALGWAGCGVLALAAAAVAGAGVRSAMLLAAGGIGWRPRLSGELAPIRPYLRIAGYQIGTRLTNFGVNRLDQVMIGSVYGPEALGLYGLAWTLIVDPIMRLNAVVNRVALPTLARVRHSRARLRMALAGVLAVLTFATAPLIVGGAAVAQTFFTVALAPNWAGAAALVQILAVASLARSIANPVGAVAIACGRVRRAFAWTAVVLSIQLVVYAAAMAAVGFTSFVGVVAAFNLAVLAGSYAVMVRPVVGPSLGPLTAAIAPNLLAAVAMGAVVAAAESLARPAGAGALLALILVGVVVYAAVMWLAFRRQVRLVARLAGRRRQRSAATPHLPDQGVTAG